MKKENRHALCNISLNYAKNIIRCHASKSMSGHNLCTVLTLHQGESSGYYVVTASVCTSGETIHTAAKKCFFHWGFVTITLQLLFVFFFLL